MPKQFVIFSVNGENFGIEITHVKEIIVPPEIFKVPNTPEFIEGLINLRGKVFTVFNLRKRFGLPTCKIDEDTKIIIVNLNDVFVGFIVDKVDQIFRIEDENLEATPEAIISIDQKYIEGIAKVDDKIILLLDMNKVVDKVAKEDIKSITESIS